MRYDKLVRDQIPAMIEAKGKNAVTHIASEREFAKKLEEKLEEEVREFLFAKTEEELADVLEVLDAICELRGFDRQRMHEYKEKKAKTNGTFTQRIILEEVV